MSFAENITAIMKERGWSDERLGQMVGVTRQAVMGWREGSMPRAPVLQRLQDIAGIPYERLFGRNPQGDPPSEAAPNIERRVTVRKSPPVRGEPIDDVDELALLALWRELSRTKKAALFAYLGVDDMPSLADDAEDRPKSG